MAQFNSIDKFGDSIFTNDIEEYFNEHQSDISSGLDAVGNVIINVADPINDSDAANKSYVDQRVLKSGDIMSGNLDMNGSIVINLSNPVNNGDSTNKNYVDNSDNLRLLKSGDAMSGTLNMGGMPIY